MYLAASFLSKLPKQIKPCHMQFQYNGIRGPWLPTTKCILEPPVSRSYKHHTKYYEVSTSKVETLSSLPKPFFYSTVNTGTTSGVSNTPDSNDEKECSPYRVVTDSAGRFINSSYWFADHSKEGDITEKVREILKQDKAKSDLEPDEPSLESLRKRIKSENLKDPNVPPGWQRKK